MNILEARRRTLGKGVCKKTVEGNPAIAQGSLARMYPGITMQGWTEQDSTTGAQLFDIDEFLELPLEPFASYGNARVLALTLKPNTNYTLSSNNIGAISGDVNKNRSLYFTTIDDMVIAAQSCAVFDGRPVTKTSDEEGKLKIVLIDRENADPIVNKEKWVMLNEGDTALPYEPYTGGQPSPSPDYPQPIKNAGKYNEDTQKWEYEITIANAQTDPDKNQTVTLTADRPLTKWDKLEKRNGQWGWVYKSEEIESYTDGGVPGEYFSTTGQLSTGAQVWYETTTETFVPLTTAEQEAMNALYTFRPTTVLSNDCGCNMTLTYKTKKSLEVAT